MARRKKSEFRDIDVFGLLMARGSQTWKTRRVASNATVLPGDFILLLETNSLTITLPNDPASEQVIIIKDVSGAVSGGSSLVVSPTGDIDGAGSFSLTDDYGTIILVFEEPDWWTLNIAAGGGGTDERVKVSANDTTPDYLTPKIVAGAGITINELNDGANETLQIVANVATAEFVEFFELSGPGDTTHVLANTPIASSQRVYLNGQFLRPGAGNDYTIAGDTITMLKAVVANDVLGVEYKF